jgi:hypothetical protein
MMSDNKMTPDTSGGVMNSPPKEKVALTANINSPGKSKFLNIWSGRFKRAVLIVLLFNSLWLLAVQRYFPEVIPGLVDAFTKPTEVTPLGAVEAVHYIGSFGPTTQVDTEQRSVLLRGVFNVAKGALLEQHTGMGDPEVCEVGTTRCAYQLGDAK